MSVTTKASPGLWRLFYTVTVQEFRGEVCDFKAIHPLYEVEPKGRIEKSLLGAGKRRQNKYAMIDFTIVRAH
ncbi:hypothetical protein [Holospora undulata]|uniref:hypothetical protein n=1 Tax=Holospora undulata TaxID=1169117 RepID=UPI0012681656|nr:hypothetical protein [Holospora undulata]